MTQETSPPSMRPYGRQILICEHGDCAPPEAAHRLSLEADEVRVLATPEPFYAVGQWYEEFPQVSDEQVVELLHGSAEGHA